MYSSVCWADWTEQFVTLFIGGVVIFFLGFVDDLIRLPALFRFIVQISTALFVCSKGLLLSQFSIFNFELSMWVICTFTVLWIVGVINAFNLIDGLDGLATGLVLISLIFIASLSFLMGDLNIVFMVLVTISASLSFLVFNFYPAKLFLGDCGATFLGYLVAIFSLVGFMGSASIMGSLWIGMLFVVIPVFDVCLTVIRRLRSRQRMFSPDKQHIHHLLLSKGFSQRYAVLLLYSIHFLLGLVGLGIVFEWRLTLIYALFLTILLGIRKKRRLRKFFF